MSLNNSVLDILDSNIINAYKIDESVKYEIKKINPKELFNFKRIDLFAKLIYIENLNQHEYAREIYKESIRVVTRGSFNEDGNNLKNSFSEYEKSFDKLINSIKNESFHGNPIPVDKNYILLDGAHRTATCYYYGEDVDIIVLDIDSGVNYDVKYFIDRGCDIDILNILLQRAIKETENIYIANVWPSALGHEKEIDRIFRKNKVHSLVGGDGAIPIQFTIDGALQYICQIYCDEAWIGTFENHYRGAEKKVAPCFSNNAPVRIYLLQANDLSKIVKSKQEIRDIFQIGNHSIHITDSHDEAIKMSELIFNNNSLYYMNYGNPFKYEKSVKRIVDFYEENFNKDIIITGSSVLSIFGISDANDLDYITTNGILLSGIKSHNEYFEKYMGGVKNIFVDQRKFFVYFGMKILTLEQLFIFKKKRNEYKDIIDLDLIKSFKTNKSKQGLIHLDDIKRYCRRLLVEFEGAIINFSQKTRTYYLLRDIYHLVWK